MSDSSGSPNAFAESAADEFFQSAFSGDIGLFDSDFLEGSPNPLGCIGSDVRT